MISFDSSASDAQATGSDDLTISHTIGGGSDRVVVLTVGIEDLQDDEPRTPTYNGVSMTRQLGSPSGQARVVIYTLPEASLPAAGTYDVVVGPEAAAGFLHLGAYVHSYTGCSGNVEATASNQSASAGSISTNITTLTDGARIVGGACCDRAAENLTATSGQTNVLVSGAFLDGASAAGDKAIATAGSEAFSWSQSGASGRDWGVAVIALEPAESGTTVQETVSEAATLSGTPSDRIDAVESASEGVTLADGHTAAIEAAFDTEVLNLTDTVTETVIPSGQTVQESVSEALSLADSIDSGPVFEVSNWRVYDDDAAIGSATPLAAENSPITVGPNGDVALGEAFRVRLQLNEQDFGDPDSDTYEPVYRRNGGVWGRIRDTGTWVRPSDSTHFSNADPVTASALTDPGGVFENGEAYDADPGSGNVYTNDFERNGFTEIVVNVSVDEFTAAIENGDTFHFGIRDSAGTVFSAGIVVEAAVAVEESVADSTALTDTATERAVAVEAISDGIALTDQAVGRADVIEAVSEQAALTDNVTDQAAGTVSEVISDPLTMAEAAIDRADVIEALGDTAALTDTAADRITVTVPLSDALSLADPLSQQAAFIESLVEAVLFDDPVSTVAIVREAVAELAEFDDTPIGTSEGVVREILGEDSTFADAVADVITAAILQQEAATFSDSITTTVGATEQVIEAITFTDTVTPSGAAVKQAIEISKAAIIRAAVRGFYR